jgi:hypothetical protein
MSGGSQNGDKRRNGDGERDRNEGRGSGDADGDDAGLIDHWPHLGPPSPDIIASGSRCPVVHSESMQLMGVASCPIGGASCPMGGGGGNVLRHEERGPFWGRWDPLPASELEQARAAAAAVEEAVMAEAMAMADEHFPRLGSSVQSPGPSGARPEGGGGSGRHTTDIGVAGAQARSNPRPGDVAAARAAAGIGARSGSARSTPRTLNPKP